MDRKAMLALLAGATGIGVAPILVRLSEVGPSSTAFYRLLFALPFLWIWQRPRRQTSDLASEAAQEKKARSRSDFWLLVLAGFCFAADLSIWHWSLQFTSVANSTLFTNFAPFFVLIGARVFLGEPITSRLLAGLLLAFAGAALLVWRSLHFSPGYLLGDSLAVVAAVFYAGYLLAVKYLRARLSSPAILFQSGLVSCPLFFLAAYLANEQLTAFRWQGWTVLVALAWISHLGGQGLIAYALAHLPAGFSSVALFWQPLVAAVLAWIVLSEPLHPVQMAGGVVILAGIFLARRRSAGGQGE